MNDAKPRLRWVALGDAYWHGWHGREIVAEVWQCTNDGRAAASLRLSWGAKSGLLADVEAAKARAEVMFAEWLRRADLHVTENEDVLRH